MNSTMFVTLSALVITGIAPIDLENGQPIGNYEVAILLYDADTDEFVDAVMTWPGLPFKFWVEDGRYYARAKIKERDPVSEKSEIVQKISPYNCGDGCHE